MKNVKLKTKILITLNFILLIVLFILSLDIKKENKIISELAPKTATDAVRKIKIQSRTTEVLLEKIATQFFLINKTNNERYEVRQEKIHSLLLSLNTKNTMQVISKNNFTVLKDDIKLILQLDNEKIISEIVFGGLDTLGLNRFVKVANGSVYKANDIYASCVRAESSYWIDRQIFKSILTDTNIQSIVLKDKTIIRNTSNKKNFALMEKALSSFQVLDILSYPLAEVQKNIISPPETLNIKLGNTHTFSLKYSKLKNGDYLIFSSVQNAHYIASAYAVENVLKAF